MSTTVLVTGIGGSMGIDVARCLRRDPSLRLLGTDGSPWGRALGRRLCDDVFELPRADRGADAFLDALDALCEKHGVGFVFVNPDPELAALGLARRLPALPHSVPRADLVATCLDKASTVAAAPACAALFPATREVEHLDELPATFAALGSPLWLRCTSGPGGKGSMAVETADEARAWIAYWRKRGRAERWMLQELLPGRNLNWTGLFVDGRLVAEAAMDRLRYFLGETTVSGVTGQVSLCATIDPSLVREVSLSVVRALDPSPRGFYSVDLREDREGRPRVTEVNPRLAGRPWLYQGAGVNLPLAALRALRGEAVGDAVAPGGLSAGVHLFRQLDMEPLIARPEELQS